MSETLYKIGQVATMLATSTRTIRYYEEESLLTPIRTEKGTRLYAQTHVQRLKAILALAHHGFSIETIKHIALIREQSTTGQQSSLQLSAVLDESLSVLTQQIQTLKTIKADIQASQQIIQACHNCKNPPNTQGCPDCPVIKQRTTLDLLNLIWDTDT